METEYVGTIDGQKVYIDWTLWPGKAFFFENADDKFDNPYRGAQ